MCSLWNPNTDGDSVWVRGKKILKEVPRPDALSTLM